MRELSWVCDRELLWNEAVWSRCQCYSSWWRVAWPAKLPKSTLLEHGSASMRTTHPSNAILPEMWGHVNARTGLDLSTSENISPSANSFNALENFIHRHLVRGHWNGNCVTGFVKSYHLLWALESIIKHSQSTGNHYNYASDCNQRPLLLLNLFSDTLLIFDMNLALM